MLPWELGFEAGMKDAADSENPYSENTNDFVDWFEGWLAWKAIQHNPE